MPTVSVIIAVHNGERYLAQAICSVLEQTCCDLELIVVDDGSTDDTRQVVAGFTDLRLRYLYQDNRERSAARNAGISAATGEYLAFLDADDYYLPEKLEKQLVVLQERPSCGAVYSDICLCDATGACVTETASVPEAVEGDLFAPLVRRNFITIHAVLLRRACLHGGLLFDERLSRFEDWDFWLRLASETQFAYLAGVVACYRVHGAMTSRGQGRMWEGALAVRRKLAAMPRFAALDAVTQQYARYQLGLLECLCGDMKIGRGVLWSAFTLAPRLPIAASAWSLSFLGRSALQKIMAGRIASRPWLVA